MLSMLNYDPKKDKINPTHCQICVQRLEEKKSNIEDINNSKFWILFKKDKF